MAATFWRRLVQATPAVAPATAGTAPVVITAGGRTPGEVGAATTAAVATSGTPVDPAVGPLGAPAVWHATAAVWPCRGLCSASGDGGAGVADDASAGDMVVCDVAALVFVPFAQPERLGERVLPDVVTPCVERDWMYRDARAIDGSAFSVFLQVRDADGCGGECERRGETDVPVGFARVCPDDIRCMGRSYRKRWVFLRGGTESRDELKGRPLMAGVPIRGDARRPNAE